MITSSKALFISSFRSFYDLELMFLWKSRFAVLLWWTKIITHSNKYLCNTNFFMPYYSTPAPHQPHDTPTCCHYSFKALYIYIFWQIFSSFLQNNEYDYANIKEITSLEYLYATSLKFLLNCNIKCNST